MGDGPQRGRYTAAGVLGVLNSGRFPRLDRLGVTGSQPAKFDYAVLLADPGVSRLRRLDLGFGVPMAAVAGCRHAAGLERLAVNSARVTDRDAAALADNPAFARLERLQLVGMNWGHPRLSAAAEQNLRDRFGGALELDYSPEEK